nr:uncharacterized protein LOC131134941 isoform X2 [Doryrhamphus excisus]
MATLHQPQPAVLTELVSLSCPFVSMKGDTAGGTKGDRFAPSRLREEGPHTRSHQVSIDDHSDAILTRGLLGCGPALKPKELNKHGVNTERRKRHSIESKEKDEGYWDKRRKNNEAAKRSREKRRANDMVLETRVLSLLEENARLRAEMLAIKFRFGLVKDFSDVSILPLTQSTQLDSDEPSYLSGSHQQDTTCEKTKPAPSAGDEHANIQDPRSLPLKLRFKAPGGETSPILCSGPNIVERKHQHSARGAPNFGQEVWCGEEACVVGDPAENVSLRSQISCLSQEVARLKQLFSNQMLTKNV